MESSGNLTRYTELKPGKPLKRSGPIKRTKPMSKAKKAKRQKEKQLERDIANVQSGYWERKAWVVWYPAVFYLGDGRCAICGTNWCLERHHIITVARRFIRWHPLNGLVLCNEHHQDQSKLSAHGRIEWLHELLTRIRPRQWAWRAEMKKLEDDAETLQGYDYKAQYALSMCVIENDRDLNWLCDHEGVAQ